MSGKVITSLTPIYDKLTSRRVFLLLSLISILIRFPFFFRDYIDRDESTFILMAQSWMDGHLPYTQLWDLKPPLVYFFIGSILYLFGKSFIAIRLIGAISVAITAFFTYQIGKEVRSVPVGFWSAIGCVYFLSLFGSLQGVMSEHLSVLFFMPAVYLLVKYKGATWYFLAGLLFGCSLMMKLNLAYALVFIGLFSIVIAFLKKQRLEGIMKMGVMTAGTILVIGITALPYYTEGIFKIWVNSVILAPMEYAKAMQNSFFKVLPLFILLLVFFLLCWKKKWLNFKDNRIQLLVVVIAGVVFSFLKSGKVNGHYLMQLYPFLLILVVIAFTHLPNPGKKFYPLVIVLAFLAPAESYLEYYNILKNKLLQGTFYNGEGFTVPAYIEEQQLDKEKILFFEYHIGYWLLDTLPPTKAATHPSNICRADLFRYYQNPRTTSLEELQYLMDTLQPNTVVIRANKTVFDKEYVAEDQYVKEYLKRNFQLETTIERAEIYTRLPGK